MIDVKPETVICKNTVSSMQAGIIYGYIGQVDYIVKKMKSEMINMGEEEPFVVATGGLAQVIRKDSSAAVFKVQLSASKKKVELVSSNFKGLKNISVASEGQLYKYMYGETTAYEDAKKLLEEAKSKGYESAYLIAFKNGVMISVQDAIK